VPKDLLNAQIHKTVKPQEKFPLNLLLPWLLHS